MPRQTTVSVDRLNGIIACLVPAITVLRDLHGVFETPFIQVIVETTLSLINTVKTAKRNKSESAELLENIHEILYCIIGILLKSENVGSLPPAMLEHLGRFTHTINQIYTFIEARQDRNTIQNLLRRSEMNTLLQDCRAGLQQASEIFKAIVIDVPEVKSFAKQLQLILHFAIKAQDIPRA
ncbi:hypothetical protein MVEN_01337300 [Mycena venus]|uniref:Uncharacterized protein n=1 Tax=Mycena venus TaxID=2733690 RepID=A0A8H6XXX5_9AGAR|nr:hypothetical protein MVEN_01337300 [Mycena venus]